MSLAGTACPAFGCQAAVSGRTIDPKQLHGRRAVLVFHGPRTTDAPKQVGKAVRAAHPDAADVVVANVVNLRSMGGLWTKVATAQLHATYERMAAKMTDLDPADYIVLCPDFRNEVGPAFGVPDSDQQPAVAVLDADGTVVGVATDGDLPAQAVAWLG